MEEREDSEEDENRQPKSDLCYPDVSSAVEM
jgi:hypothetical protein